MKGMITILTKEMLLLNIVEKYPKTQEVFSAYDEIAGKCVMCNHLFDSLESFAHQYNIDLQELISKLNRTL